MGEFALPKWAMAFASTFGVLLFTMNFVIIFMEAELNDWRLIAFIVVMSLIYIAFIIQTIMEPLSELKKLTKAELEDHEYERIIIEDDIAESFESKSS